VQRTLRRFIKTGKDPIAKSSQCNVVYKIFYSDCDASYIGQTKRQLNTRVTEHRKDINKRSGTPSVTSTHRFEFGHDFDWEDVKVVNTEISYRKRLISEMINIKKQVNSLNLQSDTESLPAEYLPMGAFQQATQATRCDTESTKVLSYNDTRRHNATQLRSKVEIVVS
ncbi:hypothetical protein X777_05214, partial [Ooceraea biroi]